MTKDRVNYLLDSCGGVDRNAVLRNGAFRLVGPYDDFSFLFLPAPVGGIREYARIDTFHHGVEVVDFKNENTVEAINESRRIATASTKKRYGFVMIRKQGIYFCHIPEGREVVSG